MKKPVLYALVALIILAQLVCMAGLFVAFDAWPMLKSTIHQVFDKSAVANPDIDLVAVQDVFGRYGFMDNQGNAVIWPRFTYAYSFSGGLAQVGIGHRTVENSPGDSYQTSDKFGFIDQTGKFIIKPKYNDAFYFREGLAVIIVDGKYGAIDLSGNIVIAPQYTHLSDFHDGYAEFTMEASQLSKEPYYVPPKGVIDKSGKIIIEPKYNCIFPKRDDRIRICRNDLFGFLDPSFNAVIEPRYAFASDFNNGISIVKDKAEQRWGAINKQGEVIIPFQYEFIKPFSDGMAAVQDPATHLWGFIDSTGKLVIPYKYLDSIGPESLTLVYEPEGHTLVFRDGLACVLKDTNRCVLIDKTGREVVKEFDLFTPLAYDPRVIYRDSAMHYDNYFNYGYSGNSLHWVEHTPGQLTFYDNQGNSRFQSEGIIAGYYSEGLCPVQRSGSFLSGKYSYIDLTGKIVFGYTMKRADGFHNGVASVDFFNEPFHDYSYIDRDGRILWLSRSFKQQYAIWIAIFSFIFILFVAYIIIRAHRKKKIDLG